MVKALFAIAAMLVSLNATAETVKCDFTEPFISITADPVTKKVVYKSDYDSSITEYTALEYKLTGNVWRVVFGAAQDENMVLEYYDDNMGGSNGMSDLIYPMTAKTWVGDTRPLIGGCSSASRPAINPDNMAFPGCYYVLSGEYEDGASYYQAIGDMILDPLRANTKTEALAKFLESALVVEGYMQVDLNLCHSIDQAVK